MKAKDYKDKKIKQPFFPISVRRHQKSVKILGIILMICFLSLVNHYDLLNLSSEPFDNSGDLRAKMVRINSKYSDSDVDFNQHGNLGYHPHAIVHPSAIRDPKANGYGVKDGLAGELGVDKSLDSKVVGSIRKDSNGAEKANKNKIIDNTEELMQSGKSTKKEAKKKLNYEIPSKDPDTFRLNRQKPLISNSGHTTGYDESGATKSSISSSNGSGKKNSGSVDEIANNNRSGNQVGAKGVILRGQAGQTSQSEFGELKDTITKEEDGDVVTVKKVKDNAEGSAQEEKKLKGKGVLAAKSSKGTDPMIDRTMPQTESPLQKEKISDDGRSMESLVEKRTSRNKIVPIAPLPR